MSYVGEELRSGDWETFAYILRFAAAVPHGQRLPLIRVVEMLKAMGRGTSTPDRKLLARQLQRLRNAELRVWTNDVAIVESWKALFPNEPLFKRGDIPGVRTSFKLLGDLVEAKTEKGNTVEFTTELSLYVRAFFGQSCRVGIRKACTSGSPATSQNVFFCFISRTMGASTSLLMSWSSTSAQARTASNSVVHLGKRTTN
ncbi:hypothetical protein PQQ72_15615 [Paraburkholderia strydomiana]|uniref:hypothetical protein n=1 Tax=Paraburkholderia strydomiana TaxID=1245417 RepID=UPI0038B8604B